MSSKGYNPTYRYKGAVISLILLGIWMSTVGTGLFVLDWSEPGAPHLACFALAVFFYTGLFITGHDAMHGNLAPRNRRLNDWIGQTCVFLYSGFNLNRLRAKHLLHHIAPATEKDPDFHDGVNESYFPWQMKFLKTYTKVQHLGFHLAACLIFCVGFGVPFLSYVFTCGVPAILSSAQLFFFCTYRTHGTQVGGYNELRSHSNNFPYVISFLACYHFGYHYEHHFDQRVPWWRLPALRKHLAREGVDTGMRQAVEATVY